MINIEQFRQNIEDWIINVVSIPNPLTGNFPPCPYAKAAWVNNVIITHPKYVLASVQSFSQLQEASDELFRLGYFQYWSEEKLAEMKAERAYQKLSYSQRKNSRRIIPTYH